jgi:hypothetical protein
MKLLIMKFSPLPCCSVPLRPKYSLNTLFSHTLVHINEQKITWGNNDTLRASTNVALSVSLCHSLNKAP